MAPTAQKPLVGHFDWPAVNPPPQNSTRPLHHTHYESPFQQVDMRRGLLQSATDFLSRHFPPSSCASRQQSAVLLAALFLVACAVVVLAVFLCNARRGADRGWEQHHRHYCFPDDGDSDCCDDQDQGFMVCEKEEDEDEGSSSPVVWWWCKMAETRRGSGAGASDTRAAGSVKPDLPPFHVSVVRSSLI